MARLIGGDLMRMLEQATKRGHELDREGRSDTKVGGYLWSKPAPKRTGSLSGTAAEMKEFADKRDTARAIREKEEAELAATMVSPFEKEEKRTRVDWTPGYAFPGVKAPGPAWKDLEHMTGVDSKAFDVLYSVTKRAVHIPSSLAEKPIVVVSDPVDLPDYLLDSLEREADGAVGAAEKGGW